MSVFKVPYATPSRLRGVYRYLLQVRGQRLKKASLEEMLSPTSLIKGSEEGGESRGMVRAVVLEGQKAGLWKFEEDDVYLAPELPEQVRNSKLGDRVLPMVLAHLFFQPTHLENHDLGRVCAWYLAQDVRHPLADWPTVEQKVQEQGVAGLLELNDARFGQFEDWFCFLGLGWHLAYPGGKLLMPDPTAFLRSYLNVLFRTKNTNRLPLSEFVKLLAQWCPLFETGVLRNDVEMYIRRENDVLSRSTALALWRLQAEGVVTLSYASDAVSLLLPKDDSFERFSHITWNVEREGHRNV